MSFDTDFDETLYISKTVRIRRHVSFSGYYSLNLKGEFYLQSFIKTDFEQFANIINFYQANFSSLVQAKR